jgi:hypothetical protein
MDVNIYIVLLRRMERQFSRNGVASLEPVDIRSVADSVSVQLVDVFTTTGVFDAILVRRAEDNHILSYLLDRLEGWYTEALLATSHIRNATG